MEKQKISAFEYVFMEAFDPLKKDQYEPRTPDEEIQHRIANMKEQASKLVVKTNDAS